MDKKLFLGGNTPDGFVSFFGDIVKTWNLKKLYILKGGSGVGKSTFIRKFAEFFKKRNGCDVTFIHCSGDSESLDGAIIESERVGIIDGTAPHTVEPCYPGVIDEIIDLGKCIDRKKLDVNRAWLDKIYEKKRACYEKAYEHLAKAREVHLELESRYMKAVDFDAVDRIFAEIIENHKT